MRGRATFFAIVTTATIAAGAQNASVGDLIANLKSTDANVRAGAACGLKEQGDRAAEAIEPLTHMLGDATPVEATLCRERWRHSSDPQTTPGELAAAALVSIGSRAVPSLLTVLQQASWIARRNAAWALGALDDPRGVVPVTTALRDREPGVREQAAWALGAMDAATAVQGLVATLKDPDDRVRRQAAWALGAIGDSSAVTGLIETLKDESHDVREQAAWALGAIGDSRASQGLVEALKDREPKVRRQAAWALGVIRK
jgi:HEAT repeat protein